MIVIKRAVMFEMQNLERALLKTRRNLWDVCRELGIEEPDFELLTVGQCAHCSVWHYSYKLQEDLDGSPICTYCENLIGR
jgi:hypothetical protein